ncbi:hypothetical protein [Aestuariirhabdus litorea]|uniref:Uncharacterized protein n=1 Tax=Aestuariirhabdus litorea TaxID=2528527 RepID=A0A3P3VPQ8_9GAMM|nr:hypothetical protein [Aestuariirhabdus litorea]RRJ84762.1 hypothetical protein D0544_06590 [Aestuariirhabdus litorea]RWW97986.1 hypothetical protein DZC74_06585 [Endozoicomonadaceae bacterium GTF-13]
MSGEPLGEGCFYWQRQLKSIIKKQPYLPDYKDNYVVARGRKLVIQGYVELVRACVLGSAARAEIFKHICDLSVQLVREAEPDVLAMTMTQLTAGEWERISLHRFNEHIQATYCRPDPRYPMIVGH